MSSEKNYVFKSLQTFTSNEWMANGTKKFRSVFDRGELNQIGVVLSFYNTKFFEEDWQTEILFSCYKEDPDETRLLFSVKESRNISNDENDLQVFQKWDPGDDYLWEKGTYCWNVYFDNKQVGETKFYVEDAGKVCSERNPYFELRDIKLYKGGKEDTPMEQREYLKQFNKKDTQYVWVQAEIKSRVITDWFGEVFYNFLDDTGMLKEQVSSFNYFEGGNEGARFLLTAGWGSEKPGYWLEDSYFINIVFMDILIGRVKLCFGDNDVEGYVSNLLVDDEITLATPDMAGAASSKVQTGPEKDILDQLNSLIGLEEIKGKIREFSTYVDFVKLRKEKGFAEEEKFILHSIFTGNPGTGKTTVVKLLGQVFKQKGLLSKGHVHEVDRAAIIGEYIGQTAPLTKKAIDKARGGILFIDEAYMLSRDTERDFGSEALEVIIKEMSDGPGDIAIMAAGYPKEMKTFMNANPGLASRFRYHYHFNDYTPGELYDISMLAAKKRAISFSKLAGEALQKLLITAYRNRDSHFGNARYANFLVDQAKLKMGIRILEGASPEKLTKKALSTVLPEDVKKIIDEIPKKNPKIPTNDLLLKQALDELNKLEGLEDVKQEIHELVKLVSYYHEMGQDVMNRFSFHTVFSGNPGTGKTTVARIIGNIYKALGVLERGHVVETGREGLVAEYVGQTAPKTKKRIDEAMDGILFIDEAYALTRNQNGSSFGQEAVEVLLKNMEDRRGRFVVIVAGYPDNMHEFLESNPGLQSRFDRVLEFKDYSDEELFRIAVKMLNAEKMYLEKGAELYLQNYMKHLVTTRNKYFGNAREVRKLVSEVIRNQNLRMADLPVKGRTTDALETIILDDVDDFVVKPIIKRPAMGFKSQRIQ
jgi:SpoVK/Ycf46/Vps4 family AAA+-type ATPase